jgi:hypothetical protein
MGSPQLSLLSNVDDIISLYTTKSGYYEFIVKIPSGGFIPLGESYNETATTELANT